MVMEVMESLESSPVGEAREIIAAVVLHVVHQGEIVVSGIQPEDQKGGDPGWNYEPEQPPDCQRPVMMTKSGVLMSSLGSAWCCA